MFNRLFMILIFISVVGCTTTENQTNQTLAPTQVESASTSTAAVKPTELPTRTPTLLPTQTPNPTPSLTPTATEVAVPLLIQDGFVVDADTGEKIVVRVDNQSVNVRASQIIGGGEGVWLAADRNGNALVVASGGNYAAVSEEGIVTLGSGQKVGWDKEALVWREGVRLEGGRLTVWKGEKLKYEQKVLADELIALPGRPYAYAIINGGQLAGLIDEEWHLSYTNGGEMAI